MVERWWAHRPHVAQVTPGCVKVGQMTTVRPFGVRTLVAAAGRMVVTEAMRRSASASAWWREYRSSSR